MDTPLIYEHLPAIINAVGVIVIGWFSYNQYTKNKKTDEKIDRWKKEEEEKLALRTENYAVIYGELWDILRSFEADRVYIIQPHPLYDNKYLSIGLEVDRKGISKMRTEIKRLSMDEVGQFARSLVKNDFMFIKSISEIEDNKIRGIFSSKGTRAVIIKHMTDGRKWVGNIVCEFTRPCHVDKITSENTLKEKADMIGYILPEFI